MARPLTERQERALVWVARGHVSSYTAKSCPSLLKRGLVRDLGHRRLVRWEVTDEGRAEADRIHEALMQRLREGTL